LTLLLGLIPDVAMFGCSLDVVVAVTVPDVVTLANARLTPV